MAAPAALFLAALTAMLLRHPDVPFYEIDRVAFVLLVVGVTLRAAVIATGCCGGAGDLADDRADASGGRERDFAAVR